jgi:hypothetical protein
MGACECPHSLIKKMMLPHYICEIFDATRGKERHTKFIGLAYYQAKDIVFRLIIEYSSLMNFGP